MIADLKQASLLSIAPMIDWTNLYFRVFMRILAPKALLYTEMQTLGAILNNAPRALAYHAMEHPIALQLGGSNLTKLVHCAQIAEAAGFDEVNLNLGCPSDRVQAGRFGACLMDAPDLVAECIAAMKQTVKIPVTAKTRIGIDQQDSYDFYAAFAYRLVEAGCDKLITHARKAWLHGLSPKENRTIPPLQYEYVYRLKQTLPDLPLIINGQIQTLVDVNAHLQHVNGVMIGRLACQNPYALVGIHHALFPECPPISRTEAYQQYLTFLKSCDLTKVSRSFLLKPILNLSHGMSCAKHWKAILLQFQAEGDWSVLDDAARWLEEQELLMAFEDNF